MHLADGELRALLDGQHPSVRQQAHLETCIRCRERLEMLSRRAERVASHLAVLSAPPQSTPYLAVIKRLQRRIQLQETIPMWKKLIHPRYRLAWAVLCLVIILGAMFAIPSVRAIANSFLGLFRVQQLTVVSVDPGDLPERLASSAQFEALLSQELQVETQGEAQTAASAAEAAQLAGMPVRLPALLEEQPELTVEPAARAVFEVDLPRLHAILDELGRSDIRLPADLDGATVTLELPASVIALYGGCKKPAEVPDVDEPVVSNADKCITLMQMPSPSISAPPGLDVAAIGQAYLQFLGMTAEEAAAFSSNVDWTTTLVIPIPRHGTTYRDVVVDGVTGSLIQQEGSHYYLLFWVKDGIAYGLSGPGNSADALEIANSLK